MDKRTVQRNAERGENVTPAALAGLNPDAARKAMLAQSGLYAWRSAAA